MFQIPTKIEPAYTAGNVLTLNQRKIQPALLADPAAWIAALIPLIPYYFYTMKKYSTKAE